MSYTVSLSAWDALLMEDYVFGKIVGAINVATPFRDKLTRVGMTTGRERLYGVQVGASQGQGARAEGEQMPDYGAGEYEDVTLKAKYNYAPFKITGQSEEFGTRKAFVQFAMRILKDTQEGLRLFTGRQCWGDGQGTLALVNNGGGLAAGTTVIPVDSAFGVAWGSVATKTTTLIKRRMSVVFGAEDNGGQGYIVTSVGSTSFTIAAPGLANAIADDTPVSIKKSANKEIEGALLFAATASFQTAVLGMATTLYHGIDRAAFPEFEGNVINAGAALSLPLIRAMRDAIYQRTDDEETDLMIGSTYIARDYEALLTPTQRTTIPTKLEGGHTVLEHDGLRFSKDSKAPAAMLAFFNTKAIAWAQTRDPHWLQDGQGIMRVVPGTDAKEALLKWYSNLDVEEPRRQGLLYNITTS